MRELKCHDHTGLLLFLLCEEPRTALVDVSPETEQSRSDSSQKQNVPTLGGETS